MAEFKLDDAQLKAVFHEALMKSLDSVSREALLAAAISHLLDPKVSNWGSTKTYTLQQIFNDCTERAAREMIIEELKKPEFQEKLQVIITAGMKKIMDDPANQLGSGISEAFAHIITTGIKGLR
jgi:hypothetical protein